MEDNNKIEETKVEETTEKKEETTEKKEVEKVDKDKIKSDGVAEYLNSLGLDESSLKAILEDKKKREDANKTDLQRATDTLTETTKQLAEEKKARLIAEAKVSAITMGVNPKLIDDFIVIAMAKANAEKKSISDVVAEMKNGENSSVYFISEQQEETKKTNNVTRKRKTDKTKEEEKEGIEATTAYRITRNMVANKNKKSSFFG